MLKIHGAFASLVLIGFCTQFSVQILLNEYISLNHDQKQKLDEFRTRVMYHLPHDYMKEDVYLIRWLRERDFDVDIAVHRLLKHISWREENRIDHILEEDWSDFDYDFKVNIEGCDKDDKPVISLRVGDWDIRKYALVGKVKKLMRYIDKIYEETERLLARMRDDGQNVTQVTIIMDFDNFNIIQQGCAQCIPVCIHLLTTYENNYAGCAHKIVAVNTPRAALSLWEILKNFISSQTNAIFFIFGKDKSEWSSALLKEIKESQLTRSYGGLKREGLDFQDLRTTGDVYRCTN